VSEAKVVGVAGGGGGKRRRLLTEEVEKMGKFFVVCVLGRLKSMIRYVWVV
jgi:hypothetical protein